MSPATTGSASADSLQSSIPYQRTKTGCKACRDRRIKCQLGALQEDGSRVRCVKCAQNLRECVYADTPQRPASRQIDVVNTKGSLSSYHNAATSPHSPTSSNSQRTPSPSYQIVSHAARTPSPSCSTLSHTISPPSRRSRISLFDGALPQECERLAMQYLFCGSFAEIGAFGATNPQRDHFQHVMLPFVLNHLANTTAGFSAEDDFVTSSAVYFSDVHRRYYALDSGLNPPFKSQARAKCLQERVRAQSCRGEKSLIGTALYDLAVIFAGGELDLRPEDFEAEVVSPIGYSLYDVLCVYDTMKAIEELREVRAPVPLTGSADLEHTFGMHRKMFQILATTAKMLHQSNSISQLLATESPELMRDECQALMHKSHTIAYGSGIQTKDYRIALGTQMAHHAVCILLKKEVLNNASVQDHVDSLLALWSLLPQLFQVGVHWTLTLAACYGDTSDTSIFPANSGPLNDARGVSDLARTLKKDRKDQRQVMPWRDVLRTAHVAVLL